MKRLFTFLLLFLLVLSVSSYAETIQFGSYEQDNNPDNGPEPVSWMILDQKDGQILVLSEFALDCRQYHTKYNNQTFYETCALRTWLNESFFTNAFTEAEHFQIQKVVLSNKRKQGYASKDGPDTEDLVFLLSFEEVETYLPTKKDRICTATPYALAQGVRTKKNAACPWWLRTSGRKQHHAACVTLDGGYYDYFDITCPTNGIRPAIWIQNPAE